MKDIKETDRDGTNIVNMSDLFDTIKEKDDIEYVNFNGVNVKVKKDLEVQEAVAFVEHAFKLVIGNDGNYIPEMYDFAVAIATISFYTNIKVNLNLSDSYRLIYSRDKNGNRLTDIIVSAIDWEQIDDLIEALNKKIEIKINADFDSARKEMNIFMGQLEEFQDVFAKSFNNANMDEIANVMSKLVENGFDEEKIARAVLKDLK